VPKVGYSGRVAAMREIRGHQLGVPTEAEITQVTSKPADNDWWDKLFVYLHGGSRFSKPISFCRILL